MVSAILALVGSASCSPGPLCPVARVSVTVSDAAGAAVNGVQVTLETPGEQPREFSCEGTVCFLTVGASASATLKVEAPGFRPVTMPATVSFARGSCCPGATLDVAQVTLERS